MKVKALKISYMKYSYPTVTSQIFTFSPKDYKKIHLVTLVILEVIFTDLVCTVLRCV